MLFHSLQFLAFFLIVYPLYLVLPHRWQNRMLFVASWVFYGAWDWRYLFLLALSTIIDYAAALGIEGSADPKRRRVWLAMSIGSQTTLLCIFKYYDFFAESFQVLMARFGLTVHPFFLRTAVPIGISFYTFQTMSYVLDVYRGKLPAAKNFVDFGLYVSYFPHLIAGPIMRGTSLLPQILEIRTVTWAKVYRGAYIFLWGLFLKVVIADNVAPIVESVFRSTAPYDGFHVLMGVYAFAFQIYCDFAGYSYMAIGLSLAMGIVLVENFRRPYYSRNISDFWRRWHISLSSWFRDYIFSPLYVHVQNKPQVRRLPLKWRHGVAFAFTLFATDFLLGMWHGVGWNYGLFGLYHALVIWIYYYTKNLWDRINPVVQTVLTFHIACGGWLIFRATSLNQIVEMFRSLLVNFHLPTAGSAPAGIWLAAVLAAILLVIEILQNRANDNMMVLKWPRPIKYAFMTLLACMILIYGNTGERPFIYFQF